MEKKVCVITGANSGIGYDVARKMAAMDFILILACRNSRTGNDAVAQIKREYPRVDISFMLLNLASKSSIEQFAKNFNASGKMLNILINNAGVYPNNSNKSPTFTEDGFELAFGTNHLGHFYLTLLLLEKIKKSTPSRIVMVSSALHDPRLKIKGRVPPHLDFDNINLIQPGTYSPMLAYANSKLANILFANELSRRLLKTGVTVNSLNPGWIPTTNLNRENPWLRCFLICCFHGICRCAGKTTTLSEGSNCVVYVATGKRLNNVSGAYFDNCQEIESSDESRDPNVARQLWDVSLQLLGLDKELYNKLC